MVTYTTRYKKPPSSLPAWGWDAAHAMVEAVKRVAGDTSNREKFAAAFGGLKLASARGRSRSTPTPTTWCRTSTSARRWPATRCPHTGSSRGSRARGIRSRTPDRERGDHGSYHRHPGWGRSRHRAGRRAVRVPRAALRGQQDDAVAAVLPAAGRLSPGGDRQPPGHPQGLHDHREGLAGLPRRGRHREHRALSDGGARLRGGAGPAVGGGARARLQQLDRRPVLPGEPATARDGSHPRPGHVGGGGRARPRGEPARPGGRRPHRPQRRPRRAQGAAAPDSGRFTKKPSVSTSPSRFTGRCPSTSA